MLHRNRFSKLSFVPSRFVAFAGDYESHTAEAEAKIQSASAEVETNIKDFTMSADDAAKLARNNINAAINAAHKKIAPTEADLQKDEVQPYINRLADARDKANEDMDENKDRYEKVAAFVKRSAEMDITLENNALTLQKLGNTSDVKRMKILLDTAAALKADGAELAGMEAPGMDTDKAALQKRVDDQVAAMESEAQGIADQVRGHIGGADALAEKIMADMKAEKLPNAFDVMNMNEHYKAMASAAYLLRTEDPGSALLADLEDAMTRIDPVIDQTDAMANKSPDFNKAKKEYGRLNVNIQRAQENYDRVMGDTKATFAEKSKATQWLAGANQRVEQAMQELAAQHLTVYDKTPPVERVGTQPEEGEKPEEVA